MNILLLLLLLCVKCLNSLKIIACKPGSLQGFYMLGISKYIVDNYNLKDTTFYGASAGAWNSLFLSLKNDHNHFLQFLEDIDTKNIDTMFNIEDIIKNYILGTYLENDYDLYKINVCVTVIENYKLEKTIYNNFKYLEDVVDCCIASSHIPYITGKSPFYTYRNKACIDGGVFNTPYPKEIKPNLVIYPDMWNNTNIRNYSKIKNLDIKKLIKYGYEDSYKNRLYLDERLLL